MGEHWTDKPSSICPSHRVRFITERQSTIEGDQHTASRVDKAYVKETVKDIIKKSNYQVNVNRKAFDDITKLEKQKAKYGRGIGKFLDFQEHKKNAGK